MPVKLSSFFAAGFHIRRLDPASGEFIRTAASDLQMGDYFALFDNDGTAFRDSSGSAKLLCMEEAPKVELPCEWVERIAENRAIYSAADDALPRGRR